jgi:uncharacterized LabA/DUF88 family protein
MDLTHKVKQVEEGRMATKGLCFGKTRRSSMSVFLVQTAFFLSYLVRNDAFLVLPPSPTSLGKVALALNGLGSSPITPLFSSTESTMDELVKDDEEEEEDDIPSMDWLTNSLGTKESELDKESTSSSPTDNEENGIAFDFSKVLSNKKSKEITERLYYMEEHSQSADDLGDVPIPTTGISVADEMAAAQKDQFTTELVPIQKGLGDRGVRAAQIVTFSQLGSFEPVRYLVQLDKVAQNLSTSENEQENQGVDSAIDKKKKSKSKKESTEKLPQSAVASTSSSSSFVIVDIPPFSEQLASDIRTYMGSQGQLLAMLVTHRDGIHYDEARAVYATRRADLQQWVNAFPNLEIVAYRLDIPRDCRESVTQILDGYGPFALDNNEQQQHAESYSHDDNNVTFIETGRPLTYAEWDHDVAQDIMTRGYTPPDDAVTGTGDDDELYTPQAIRAREEGKRVLALYTPGATFGSLTYVFPNVGLCCSGLTIPVEDSRSEENRGISQAGPALDCRGYITTSKAGITRQMESARRLVNSYCDRFDVVLPSRGDPLFLDGTTEERREELLEILDDYDRIGKIYEQLGITSFDDDD